MIMTCNLYTCIHVHLPLSVTCKEGLYPKHPFSAWYSLTVLRLLLFMVCCKFLSENAELILHILCTMLYAGTTDNACSINFLASYNPRNDMLWTQQPVEG